MSWEGIVRRYDSVAQMADVFFSEGHYFQDSPQQLELETDITAWTEAEASAATNCGMAAIGAVIESLVRPGDSMLFSNALFPGTTQLALSYIEQWGISVHFVDPTDLQEVARLIELYKPTLYLFEVIGNSMTMPVADWAGTREVLQGTGTVAVVDTTFQPLFFPLSHNNGDVEVIEVASMSKWETMDDEVAAGRISGSGGRIAQIKNSPDYRQVCIQPSVAAKVDVNRILKLYSQFSVHALSAAMALEQGLGIEHVYYPRLDSHPQFQLVVDQYCAYAGGVMYVVVEGGSEGAATLADYLNESSGWSVAPSFGADDWRILPFVGELAKEAPRQGLVRIASGLREEGLQVLREWLGQ